MKLDDAIARLSGLPDPPRYVSFNWQKLNSVVLFRIAVSRLFRTVAAFQPKR